MQKLGVLIGLLLLAQPAQSDDWPQYRGPRRDDVSRETGLLKSWPEGGPALAWTYTSLGIGYSGVAIVGGRLYSIGARGESEFLMALEEAETEFLTMAFKP